MFSRLVLGGVFVSASVGKILDPFRFLSVVENYHLLPPPLVPFFTLALPWCEFLAGVLLLLGFAVPSAALLLAMLLAMFMVGIGFNLVRGVEMECGCFGWWEGGERLGWGTLLRDLGLLLLALQLTLAYAEWGSLEGWLARRKKALRHKL